MEKFELYILGCGAALPTPHHFCSSQVLNIREKIVHAIPIGVRLGIGPAIGLMLMNIGFGSNVGVYTENGGPFYAMRDFFGALTASYAKEQMGSGYPVMVLTVITMFLGLAVIVVLISALCDWCGVSAVNPANNKTITAFNLFTVAGLQYFWSNVIANFAGLDRKSVV